jgi:VWFA-related protein
MSPDLILRRAALAIAAALILQQPPQQTPPTFRSGIDVVTVDVSVRDRVKVISGLTAADFDVLDNGVRQNIVDVSYDKLPIDVTLALDVSRSVSGDMLDRLRDATVQLMKDLAPVDRLRLITFHARISRVIDFTNDVKAVERAIKATTAGGGTSIFDTVTTSLVSADQNDRRQLLVLFTDGVDSTSITEPAALYEVAQRMNVAVTTVMPVGMVSLRQSGAPPIQITSIVPPSAGGGRNRVFARLASDTGGQVIPQIPGGSDLTRTFRQVLEQFRSSYVLHFVPNGVERSGFHNLQVTVPKQKTLLIRARRGYWAQ